MKTGMAQYMDTPEKLIHTLIHTHLCKYTCKGAGVVYSLINTCNLNYENQMPNLHLQTLFNLNFGPLTPPDQGVFTF